MGVDGDRRDSADVRAFALIRTMGLQPEVEKIVMPSVGVIRRNAQNDAVRNDDVPDSPATLL